MKFFTPTLTFILLLCGAINSTGQQTHAIEPGMSGIYQAGTIEGKDSLQAVIHFIKENTAEIGAYPDALELSYFSQSPFTRHYQFRQLFAGIQVADASVVVNVNRMGHVTSFFNHLVNTSHWDVDALLYAADQFPLNAALALIPGFGLRSNQSETESRLTILPGEHPSISLQIEYFNAQNSEHRELRIDSNLNLLENRDLHRYFSGDTIASAKVFLPDPLTSAHKTYGVPYIDNNDADNLALSNERKTVSITVKQDMDTLRLESPYIKMVDLQPPLARPAVSATGSFDFTRSESGFEDVNAFYHLNAMHDYLVQTLGFTGLADFQVQVDAHGDLSDNSYFVSDNPPRLILGEGGVDDAEDADVIIHEYGHGVSYSANGNYNTSVERDALDEGFSDYLAASYSRSIDVFNWGDVFNWDGHNEFWNGRIVNSTAHYPEDMGSDIYINGEIWSSVMMENWTALGRETTDKLMIESLYSWSEDMTMKDAAMLILNADAAQNNGANYFTLFTNFYNRGLLDNLPTSIVGTSPFIENTGKLMIYVDQQAGPASLEIFDMQGRLIKKLSDFSDKIMEIPRDWFASSGMYIVRLKEPNETVTQKVIYIAH